LPCRLPSLPVASKGWIAAQVVVIYLIRLILTLRFRTSWLGLLLHPVGHALALAIGLNSWRRSALGGVMWKGRTYEIRGGGREPRGPPIPPPPAPPLAF